MSSIPQILRRIFPYTIVFGCALWVSYFLLLHRYEVPAEGDLGCFMAIAQHLRQGAWLYDSVWDNKAPGIFLYHVLAQAFTNSVNYPVYITIGGILLLAASAAYVFKNVPISRILIIAMLSGYFLLRWFLFWEVSFIGGFTEEIGMLLVLTSLVWFVAAETWLTNALSGLFLGLAIFTKEPFALFIPGFWLAAVYRSKWQIKYMLSWHAGLILPWFTFALIYLGVGRFHFIQQYLEGAFKYTSEANSTWSVYQERWHRILTFANPFIHENQSLITGFFRIFWLRLAWLGYRKIRYRETYPVGIWYMLLGSGFIASAWFLALGPHAYLHYGMPHLVVYVACLTLVGFDLVQQLKGRFWEPWQLPVLALISCWVVYTFHLRVETKALSNNFSQKEKEMIQQKLPNNATVFVDQESMGRFYWYLNANVNSRYPTPYYTFFYVETDNQRADLVHHRARFREDFLRRPPAYILSTSVATPAPVFNFTGLNTYVQEHYTVQDSVNLHTTLYLRAYH